MRGIVHSQTCIISDEDLAGRRVDVVSSLLIDSFTRSHASQAETRFLINGNEVRKSRKVSLHDTLEVIWVTEDERSITAQNIPLDILYEDPYIIVINKPVGMSVHPGAGEKEGTLVNALAYHLGENWIREMADERIEQDRPGIVHRLDKPTSGTLVIAKTRESLFDLKKQFRKRITDKYYIAVVHGNLLPPLGTIENFLVRDEHHRTRFAVSTRADIGKHAVTEYEVLKQYSSCALVRIHLITGRTHQIRVHMAAHHTPIEGDTLYGDRRSQLSLMLHALSLSFRHPETGERVRFTSPMPDRFREYLLKQS